MFATGILLAALSTAVAAQDGVFNDGPTGADNPKLEMGTAINQASMSRIASLNSIDDFCIYGPPEPNSLIGNVEGEVVSYCTKARNGARIIPDGTITGLSFLKTDFYVQLYGYGDFTKIGIQKGDDGGELDPHGAEGTGNPVGGDVVVNINGEDKYIKEWMMYMSADAFCFRACTNANATYSAAEMCEHKLDVMGCEFVMPGNYQFQNTFETCDAEVAYPPGWYPQADGSFSKFAQYWTGIWNGEPVTNGDLVTPAAPASTPKSSNCQTTSTIGNGIPAASLASGATGPVPTNEAATKAGAAVTVVTAASGGASGTAGTSTGVRTTTSRSSSASGASGSAASSESGSNGASSLAVSLFAIVASVLGVSFSL